MDMKNRNYGLKRLVPLAVTCVLALSAPVQAVITTQDWSTSADDRRPANLYTLTNAAGMEVRISNYGGVIISIKAPGRGGAFADVVQGFDTLTDYTSEDYIRANGHYGATIGRFANRIKGAKLTIDGQNYALD